MERCADDRRARSTVLTSIEVHDGGSITYLMIYFRIMLKSGITSTEVRDFIKSRSNKAVFKNLPYWMVCVDQ